MLNTITLFGAGAVVFLSRSPELAWLAKATLILLSCLAITRMTRRARASVRHVIIAASFASLIALPVLIAFVPAIGIEVEASAAAVLPPLSPAPSTAPPSATTSARNTTIDQDGERTLPPISWPQLLRAVWIAGAVVFLLPLAAVLWRLSMIRRTGIPVAWHKAELSRLADARGVSVTVELLEHEAVPGPMTFGISRPVIVLPLDAREWSEGELRRALMHELEHIQRGDWVMQIVARTVAAVYWFHPLVWSAWRRLCLEAERSCDDAVVISEERTDYAEQLVTLAQRMAATPVQPMLGMANRSDLSTRVTAVLDDRLRRGRAGFAFASGTIAAAALVVLTVAPVRAIEKQSTDNARRVEVEKKIAAVESARVEVQKKILEQQAQDTDELKAKLLEARKEMEELERKLRAAQGTQTQSSQQFAEGFRARLVERARDMEQIERKLREQRERAEPSRRVRAIDRALYEAANEGHFDEVKELVQAGANPGARVDGDGSPLIGAARSGRIEIARYLLDQGADPNGTVAGDGSPLITAASHGRFDQVQLLVERGADVNLAVEGDENPLMNAAEGGHLAIVQYLVSKGADIHTRIFTDKSGSGDLGEWRTAISQARKNGHTAVVKYLESLGARDQ